MWVMTSNIILPNHLTNAWLQIYRDYDKPYYRVGNKVLIALSLWSLFMFIVAKYYYVRRNKQNAAIWDNMSSEEREQYVAENKNLGNKR